MDPSAIMLEVRLTGDGLITPEELPRLLEKVGEVIPCGGQEAVIISGRLPVWAYAALVHWFHPRPWLGTFEPRLHKAVVVVTHTHEVKVGQLMEANEERTITVAFP